MYAILVTFLDGDTVVSLLFLSPILLALSPMSMTAPLGLAVTPRVNESRLSVSRRAGMMLSHEGGKSEHNVCIYAYPRIIFDASLYHAGKREFY